MALVLLSKTLHTTGARVKSYQLAKVVSGGRVSGKSSIMASLQLSIIATCHCFGAVRRAPGKSSMFVINMDRSFHNYLYLCFFLP